jgi:predicted aspartyl protease
VGVFPHECQRRREHSIYRPADVPSPRVDDITHSGRVETDYDDFRTIGGYTIAFDSKTHNEVSRTQSETKIVTFEARSVPDSDLRMPPTKPFVTFPAGLSSVELPARFVLPHVIVRIMVGNRGLDFILDSGAGGIFIDSDVARELGLKPFAEHSAVTAGRYDTANAIVPEMRVGSLTMQNVAVQIGPLGWEEGFGGVKSVGLLGYDFIRSIGLTIDYEHKRVTAVEPKNLTPPVMTPESDILPISLGSHQPMIAVTVNGAIAERMVVDTGWSTDLGLFDYFIRRYPEAFDPKIAFRFDNTQVYSGVGGRLKTRGYRLKTVDIGRYHLNDFDALVVVAPESYEGTTDGVIGPGILQHFTVVFDYAGGKMYLVHNEGQ